MKDPSKVVEPETLKLLSSGLFATALRIEVFPKAEITSAGRERAVEYSFCSKSWNGFDSSLIRVKSRMKLWTNGRGIDNPHRDQYRQQDMVNLAELPPRMIVRNLVEFVKFASKKPLERERSPDQFHGSAFHCSIPCGKG